MVGRRNFSVILPRPARRSSTRWYCGRAESLNHVTAPCSNVAARADPILQKKAGGTCPPARFPNGPTSRSRWRSRLVLSGAQEWIGECTVAADVPALVLANAPVKRLTNRHDDRQVEDELASIVGAAEVPLVGAVGVIERAPDVAYERGHREQHVVVWGRDQRFKPTQRHRHLLSRYRGGIQRLQVEREISKPPPQVNGLLGGGGYLPEKCQTFPVLARDRAAVYAAFGGAPPLRLAVGDM